jgi:hypothetical protein
MPEKLIFNQVDLLKELTVKNGVLVPADTKKELVLQYTSEEQKQAIQDWAIQNNVIIPADKIQRASQDVRTAQSYAINNEADILSKITYTSDAGARRLRTFQVLVNDLIIKPLLGGSLTIGADIYKEIIESERKGFMVFNKSPYTVYVGEHTEVDILKKHGFPILAGQGISDALLLSGANIIADSDASGGYCDVRVWVTYLK